MRIGTVELPNNTILAPLAGITNLPFRLMAKREGCGLVCSEMVSSNGLVYHSHKTRNLLASVPEEKPLSVQIFGADPAIMAAAARLVEADGADIIDINCGCSVKKILKSGSGSALMKDFKVAEAVIRAVRQAVQIPLTLKIRSGWDASGEQALGLARIAEDCGVDAIALHPRSAKQGFGGDADWFLIEKLKRHVALPVIGNGDIRTPQDALRMVAMTGCDAIMVGRAAIGNPWIFSQILALQAGKTYTEPSLDDRFHTMATYVNATVTHIGELHACRMMRSRLGWFVKGLSHNGKFREAIKCMSTEAEILGLLQAYQDRLERV